MLPVGRWHITTKWKKKKAEQIDNDFQSQKRRKYFISNEAQDEGVLG